MKHTHAVIDLETLAVVPQAMVLEVGVVFMTPGLSDGARFSMEVAPFAGGDQLGRVVDADTLEWWAKRMKEGIEMPGIRSENTLGEMVDWFLGLWDEWAADGCEVWCQGLAFDVAILTDVLASYGYDTPWGYWNERCLRTVKKVMGYERREGYKVAHRALPDAMDEARELREILERMKGGEA